MDPGRVAVQLRGLLSGLRPGQGRFCLVLGDPGRVTLFTQDADFHPKFQETYLTRPMSKLSDICG